MGMIILHYAGAVNLGVKLLSNCRVHIVLPRKYGQFAWLRGAQAPSPRSEVPNYFDLPSYWQMPWDYLVVVS